MVTQKDVHNNIVVNASAWQKRYLSLQFQSKRIKTITGYRLIVVATLKQL